MVTAVTNARVFKDVTSRQNPRKARQRTRHHSKPDVAIIYDWENRWALNDIVAIGGHGRDMRTPLFSIQRALSVASVDIIDRPQTLLAIS